MQQHNTHLLSEQSNENHGYDYDKFGNIIADSVDDLIYDKFIDIKNIREKRNKDTNNLIKNIIKNEFPSSEISQRESKINEKKRASIREKKIEEKKEKRK